MPRQRTPEITVTAERGELARGHITQPPCPVLGIKQQLARPGEKVRRMALEIEELSSEIQAQRQKGRVAELERIAQRPVAFSYRFEARVFIIGREQHLPLAVHQCGSSSVRDRNERANTLPIGMIAQGIDQPVLDAPDVELPERSGVIRTVEVAAARAEDTDAGLRDEETRVRLADIDDAQQLARHGRADRGLAPFQP